MAAIDVTDPEPLPRDHPLLETRQRHHHAAPRQRHGTNAATYGGDVGGESNGGAGGERAEESRELAGDFAPGHRFEFGDEGGVLGSRQAALVQDGEHA